jgi:hypothetical protein
VPMHASGRWCGNCQVVGGTLHVAGGGGLWVVVAVVLAVVEVVVVMGAV